MTPIKQMAAPIVMTALGCMALASAGLAPDPARAQAKVPLSEQSLCASVKVILRAAKETPSFHSIAAGAGAPSTGKEIPPEMASCKLWRIQPKDSYICDGPNESETDVQVRQILVNSYLEQCLGVQGQTPSFMDRAGPGQTSFKPAGDDATAVSTFTGSQISVEPRFRLSVDTPSH